MGWLRLNVAWKGGNVVCLFVQFLSFVLVVFGWARSAEACTCGRTKDVWDKYVVFVGKAVESADRPVSTDEDEEDFWELQLAVRYEVEASNRLKRGDEVLVFRTLDGPACGGGTHRVGDRGIVVAYDTDGVLRTSSCAVIPDEEKASILKKLHLPETFDFRGEPFSGRKECRRPGTVAEAFRRADAVLWSRTARSCWNEEAGRVERLVAARNSWKGPPPGEWFIVGAAPGRTGSATGGVPGLSSRTGHWWPPAEFLEQTGPARYEDTGCLVPSLPISDEAIELAVEELEELMPIPEERRRTPRPTGDPPSLSCSTISQADFDAAKSKLKERRGRLELERKEPPAEATEAVSPPNGGCASCSAGRGGPLSATSLLVSLGVLLSTRRRRRRNRG